MKIKKIAEILEIIEDFVYKEYKKEYNLTPSKRELREEMEKFIIELKDINNMIKEQENE